MASPSPDTAAPAGASGFGPLRIPVFRAVWLASMASNFGGLIQSVGASWMMVSIAASAEMVALVQASVTLPIMLLALVAGALADNFDRRKLMLGAQVFMLAVSAALSACAWMGWITPWLLLTFTFLIGCGTAFNGPAWQASVGEMVPRAELPGAVALNSAGYNIARSLGPALGGAIVAAAGAAAAFAVNAVSYLGLIVVLARWRPERPPPRLPPERLGVAIGAGLRYVAMSPAIRVVIVRAVIFGLGACAIPAMMPLIASEIIAGGPLTYGLLLGAFGAGAVLGALASARLRDRLSSEGIARLGALGFAIAAAGTAVSTILLPTMALLVLAGACWVLALSTFNVTVQLHSPRWVVARALAVYQMGAFGGMAAGSWVWGRTAELASIEIALLAAAGVQLLCMLFGLVRPLPPIADLNLDPLREWSPPETAVPIEPRSGPIVITIDYRIRPDDIAAFLTLMAERRRVRLRDGARHWSLLRDLADPEVWIERFHAPTWLDYIRHNNRVTQADADVTQRLRALHQGPEPLKIRRMVERQTGSLPGPRLPTPPELADPLTDPHRNA